MGLLHKFNEGGVFMYFILLFGLFSIAVMIERYIALYKKTPEPTANFRKGILGFLTSGDLNGAERAANEDTAQARIARLGIVLRAQGAGDEEIQARMDEALSKEIHHVDRRTGFLAMFGNVATLLGLLGTISGMIGSFAAVASANPSDRATMLSKGISEAMNCTAFGLIVAIPALVSYALFQNKTDRFVNSLTTMTSEIFHDLLFLVETDRTSNRFAGKNTGTNNASIHTN